ncbi:MAG: hypothetical protein HND52_19810 [Ignavibacteriae bacterium]|nr:hypothetical protein [Ignavibacteriota bacterium]NOH00215.1 hypothetical protein [Ignavibacteriota bacterium]
MKSIFLFLGFLIFVFGCRTTVEDVDEYFNEGNYEELCYIVARECKEPREKRDDNIIRHAIKLLLDNKIKMGVVFLEDLYWDGQIDYIYESMIIDGFNRNGLIFLKVKKLCEENYISDAMEKMILRSKDISVYQLFVANDLKENNRYPDKDFFEAIRTTCSSDTEIINWLDDLKIEMAEFEAERELQRLKDKIKNLKIEIYSLAEVVVQDKEFWSDVITIRGYILKQISDSFYNDGAYYRAYEVSLDYDDLHSLLYTSQTVFTSRGRFSLDVKLLPDKFAAKVKGGFTQYWNVYLEVSEEKYEERDENLRKYREAVEDLKYYKKELALLQK